MFGVARRAIGSAHLPSMVDRTVMTRETSLILDLGREDRGLLDVARCALRFEDGVRRRHAAAAVDPRIFVECVPENPQYGQHRREKTQPELSALQRSRPLEIVEIDALREFFGGACSSHVVFPTADRSALIAHALLQKSSLNTSVP